jgi:hypothetical protein
MSGAKVSACAPLDKHFRNYEGSDPGQPDETRSIPMSSTPGTRLASQAVPKLSSERVALVEEPPIGTDAIPSAETVNFSRLFISQNSTIRRFNSSKNDILVVLSPKAHRMMWDRGGFVDSAASP